MGYFFERKAKTGLPCPSCGEPLIIERGCKTVWMFCPVCSKKFPVRDFIAKADPAMEAFLENVYFDRI